MFVIHIILAILAYSPIAALAAPTAAPGAEGVQFAPTKNLADDIHPVKKLYSGPWSSFPAMTKWIGFDAMVGSFKIPTLLHTARSPIWAKSLPHVHWRAGWGY